MIEKCKRVSCSACGQNLSTQFVKTNVGNTLEVDPCVNCHELGVARAKYNSFMEGKIEGYNDCEGKYAEEFRNWLKITKVLTNTP